ncbi:MAG TPA: 4Fe-4S dicluster domain-containing protein [Desulfobacterales bacterium]|nr:4Fe-4S dicluster domain-containing protein [Desulfobacterales bacterium]
MIRQDAREARGWSRRQFLWRLALGAMVVTVCAPSPVLARRLFGRRPDGKALLAARYWLAVYPDRCTGCGVCVAACRKANHLPPAASRIAIHQHHDNRAPSWLPVPCQQCGEAPCITVCPTRASFRDEVTGLVLIDRGRCVGCRACVMACPYGARRYLPEEEKADGCDFCLASRLLRGEKRPACVESCPQQVFRFGVEAEEPLAQVFPSASLMILRPERGTRPAVVYRFAPPQEER